MGKRKATITPHALEKLSAQGLSQEEVGQIFGVTQARISQILSDPESPERIAWEAGRGNLAKLLKQTQLEMALGTNGKKPNALMCIWLSKQYLGFADKQDAHETHDINVNIQFVAAWGKTPQQIADSDTNHLENHHDTSEHNGEFSPDSDIIDSTATEDPDPPLNT